jgi:hypothetical protein
MSSHAYCENAVNAIRHSPKEKGQRNVEAGARKCTRSIDGLGEDGEIESFCAAATGSS